MLCPSSCCSLDSLSMDSERLILLLQLMRTNGMSSSSSSEWMDGRKKEEQEFVCLLWDKRRPSVLKQTGEGAYILHPKNNVNRWVGREYSVRGDGPFRALNPPAEISGQFVWTLRRWWTSKQVRGPGQRRFTQAHHTNSRWHQESALDTDWH